MLRPTLGHAIERLRSGTEGLEQHAERLLIWPSAKKSRTAALEQYKRLLDELESYLGKLGDYKGVSAVGLADLEKVKAEIKHSTGAFDDTINDLLVNLDKSELMSLSGGCARVIEALRIAFR